MSTREDREWDERQEYGYSHPLDPFARHSAILADQLGPIEPEDYDPEAVDNPVDAPIFESLVWAQHFDPLEETPGQTSI